MSNHRRKFTLPLALAAAGIVTALPVAASSLTTTSSAASNPVVYETTLGALNGSGASGTVQISLDGNRATVTEHVAGLATTFNDSPYPHVQHIHIGGEGACPSPSADANGDGIVDTVEGVPAYGMVSTSLTLSGDTGADAATTLETAPSGGSYDYQRTFDLDEATVTSLQSGKAVVVVHGLDPSTLSPAAQEAMSNLVPSLPLAATAPALCGVLAQVAATPPPASTPPTTMAPMTPATPMPANPTFTG